MELATLNVVVRNLLRTKSHVLMLSENARGDANPILLIDEDDVEAGHAASVGRVDPGAIILFNEPWYFKS